MPISMLPKARMNVLALRERMRGMSDGEYLQALIAYHAAPTFLKMKPATLICPQTSGRDLETALRESAPCLACSFGVRVAPLRNQTGAFPIFVYHPELLRGALIAEEARELLAEAGYDVSRADVDALVGQLGEKYRGNEFPHEIGVFLGYPVSDVRCFIASRGRGCCVAGCWKAYTNPEQAEKRSTRFQWAKMRAAELILSGADLNEVVTGLRVGAA